MRLARGLLRDTAKVTLASLILLLVAECLLRAAYLVRNHFVGEVPLPYVIGQNYGPIPPWHDGLRILTDDRALIWRNRPHVRRRYVDVFSPAETEAARGDLLRRFLPSLPESLRGNPTWEISLNAEGFRDREFPTGKAASTLRVVCLGDSWTFGWNVGQEDSYPRQLEGLLERRFPDAHFEVLNLGVGGYSSYQGLELLKSRGVVLQPDVVVIAFAMNDASVPGYRDRDVAGGAESPGLFVRLAGEFQELESYKLLRYLALLVKHEDASIGDQLAQQAKAPAPARTASDYEKIKMWTRVPLEEYEENITEMVRLARRGGAEAILVYNELTESGPYRSALHRVAAREKVPLVDSAALIARKRLRIEEGIERRLDLRAPAEEATAPPNGEVETVFRVFLGDREVPEGIYIAGAHDELGSSIPNRVRLYDDATHGDQRADDHVWSYAASFTAGTTVHYVYTNSGREGVWEGLDVPHLRSVAIKTSTRDRRTYLPIESFGRIYMQADSWHTTARGHALIAEALLARLLEFDSVALQ